VRGENVDTLLIVADLGSPEILNLLRVLGGIQHPPAIDTQLTVGKWNRG
jgi:hypothetical protein